MADSQWFEVEGVHQCPNIEAATTAARTLAGSVDEVVEIYRVERTLVRTVERTQTITVTDVP
jgi:hypothetical protein